MKIVLANCNPIHRGLEQELTERFDAIVISNKKGLNLDFLNSIKPDYIFFPHWSYIIPSEIYNKFECVVFHMTDLPYGRGGSPLQNLIVRGREETKITALKVEEGLDTGAVYLKKEMGLFGTAEEIFLRSSSLIFDMICEIVEERTIPKEQEGEITIFKRRKPEDGNIEKLESLEEVFDYIRMLDAEGYPRAFVETESLRIEFFRASRKKDSIIADVRIIKK